MRGKIFSVNEANRMVPLVARIADDIVSTYGEVNRALQAYEEAKALTSKDDSRDAELRRRDAEVAEVLERFQGLILEIEALGGTVKDYEQGFIDFYGDVGGEIVYLCWSRGESNVSHWHRLDEGYGKRRDLPTAPAAAA
jgi:hypothetical protein